MTVLLCNDSISSDRRWRLWITPAIAKVLDADSTPEGQPYFVMEYVPGLPITTYCDQKKLTTRERLKLFHQGVRGGATRTSKSDYPS